MISKDWVVFLPTDPSRSWNCRSGNPCCRSGATSKPADTGGSRAPRRTRPAAPGSSRHAAERGLRAETDRNGNLWAWWDPPGGSGPAARPWAGRRDRHRQPPGLGARRRRVRRPARRRLRVRGRRPCCARQGLAPGQAGRRGRVHRGGGRAGSAWPASGSRLLTGVVAPQDAARADRRRTASALAEAMAAAGLDPAAIGPDARAAGADRRVRRTARRAGQRAGRHARGGRRGRVHLAARPVADRLRRAGRPRGHHEAGRPARPDAAVRGDGARRQEAADRPWRARHVRQGGGRARRVQRDQPRRVRLAGRPRARRGAARRAGRPGARRGGPLRSRARRRASSSRCESFTPVVEFDRDLRDRVVAALAARGHRAPVLPTGAGHDAGVLAARLPTAMLFVRNPTGVSHSPAEHAEPADCEAGVVALAAVLAELACR